MKKGLIITAIVILFLGAGAYYGIRVNQGKHDSELAIIGPGQPITFTVDGGQAVTVPAKGRKIIKVEPGRHTVAITAPAPLEHSVQVPEFKRVIVPAIRDQCFAKLDVSLSHYGKRRQKIAPALRELKKTSEPFELPKTHHLHPNELPGSNVEGQPVWLYRSASCAALEKLQRAQQKRQAELLGG